MERNRNGLQNQYFTVGYSGIYITKIHCAPPPPPLPIININIDNQTYLLIFLSELYADPGFRRSIHCHEAEKMAELLGIET